MDKGIKAEPLGRGVKVFVSALHTFGTDAVLLAHFAKAKSGDRMVDLGTGCGIVPFIVMRDKRLESCYGVDICESAIALAQAGAKENGFTCFKAVCADIADLKGKVPFGSNTLVTFNPPYKAAGAGLESRDPTVRTARHESTCDLKTAVTAGAKLLQTGGRLVMCQRPERTAELITVMSQSGTQPKRMRLVAKCPGKKPWLVLIEGKRSAAAGLVIEPTLYVEDGNGGYSQEMLDIYGVYKEEFLH